jgi:hypothetical protein
MQLVECQFNPVQELECHHKTISSMFFEPGAFARYINCAMKSVAGRRELEISDIPVRGTNSRSDSESQVHSVVELRKANCVSCRSRMIFKTPRDKNTTKWKR